MTRAGILVRNFHTRVRAGILMLGLLIAACRNNDGPAHRRATEAAPSAAHPDAAQPYVSLSDAEGPAEADSGNPSPSADAESGNEDGDADYETLALADSLLAASRAPLPFDSVLAHVRKAWEVEAGLGVHFRNGLDSISEDTLEMLRPWMRAAFARILAYRQGLSRDSVLPGPPPPSIIADTSASDTAALGLLPESAPSPMLARGRFHFIGGEPFLKEDRAHGGGVVYDAHGKPEIRYANDQSAATANFLAAARHYRPGAIEVGFGEPIRQYDAPPLEIGGIGSLIHRFRVPVPVWLLTEGGPVEGRAVSVDVPLAPGGFCVDSDLPEILFASSSIPHGQVLAVYIPWDAPAPVPKNATLRRKGGAWIADLDGDGIPEFAGVIGRAAGIASDSLSVARWYANSGGQWRRIDSAAEEDCT